MSGQDPGQVRRSFGQQQQQHAIPRAPPLPAPRPLQRARDVASRFLGYGGSRPPSPQSDRDDDRFTLGSSQFTRSSSLGATNATASHKTGLEIRTISINERGTHAIIAGKDIFKTIRVEDGHCAEDVNLRTAIRSTPTTASGKPREAYGVDIADVAWAKGDSGDYVAAATSSGKIILYDLGHAGLQAAQLHEHYRQVHNVTFNPHKGSLLLSGSQDGTVRLWDLRDLRNQAQSIQSKRRFAGQSEGVRDVKWSPTEGVDFAFGTENGEIQRWDIRNLKVAKMRVPAHRLACNTVDWHPDGKHILSAGTDHTVRVFDVSTSRPKKASWEIKAPHPALFARWRPSCQSAMPQDNGAMQCTQIVTAYDQHHPIMHVWDFRRPHLPFRELQPYMTAPTDLLWHSQDLLWTVGREGTFYQIDIQHTSKVIDRLSLQALDVSPRGELAFITQKRHHRRTPKTPSVPSLDLRDSSRSSGGMSSSPESNLLSRSWADDSLDHSFLSVLPSKRQNRSSSRSRVHGAFSSSYTVNNNSSATIKLDDILHNRKSFRPQQVAFRGQLPGHNNPEFIVFMANKARTDIPAVSNDDDFLREAETAFNANEDCAHSIGLYRTAQVWKMVSFCTITHLRERIAFKRKAAAEKKALSPPQDGMTTSIEDLATRFAAQHLKSPAQSPGTLRPVSTIAHHLTMPESTSNVPTPLARPSTSNTISNSPQRTTTLPDPDTDETLALPPSLASHTMPPPRQSDEPPPNRQLTADNLQDLQKLEHAKEADRHEMVQRWSNQPKPPLSLDPVDADGIKIPPAKLEHHGSGESFQFLEDSIGSRASSFPASLDSTHSPIAQMVSERPSRPKRMDTSSTHPASTTENEESASAHQSLFFGGSGTLANSAGATKENSINNSMIVSDEAIRKPIKANTDSTDFAFRTKEDPDVLKKRSQALKDQSSIFDPAFEGSDFFGQTNARSRPPQKEQLNKLSNQAIENIIAEAEAASPIDSILDEGEEDLELNKPWSLVEMLQQYVHHYTVEQPYPQMAALLILLLGPLLPRTHPVPVVEVHQTISGYVDCFLNSLSWHVRDIPSLIKQSFEHPLKAGLSPLQVESILSTYHEQLLAHELFEEAAVLRKLAYPAYPAVYEDFIKDNHVHLMCGQCSKPMSSSGRVPLRCESCREQARACPICWLVSSPFEKDGGGGGRASKLFSACLLCGHSGHAACLQHWFVDCEGEGCPTEGCLCDCVASSWRDQKTTALAEQETKTKGHERVMSDEWMAKESGAAERARKMV